MKTDNNYQEEAKRTFKNLNSKEEDSIHMLLGLASEVGELQDAYKKHLAYGKDLDIVNVLEEIGDIKWYISNFCTVLGVKESDVERLNIEKLKQRYPDKFTNECANVRDLEAERKILEKNEQ